MPLGLCPPFSAFTASAGYARIRMPCPAECQAPVALNLCSVCYGKMIAIYILKDKKDLHVSASHVLMYTFLVHPQRQLRGDGLLLFLS